MTIHKRILEWQVAHPNVTWIGWGICMGNCSGRPALAAGSEMTETPWNGPARIEVARERRAACFPVPSSKADIHSKPLFSASDKRLNLTGAMEGGAPKVLRISHCYLFPKWP
jgi:hypothetical protein